MERLRKTVLTQFIFLKDNWRVRTPFSALCIGSDETNEKTQMWNIGLNAYEP